MARTALAAAILVLVFAGAANAAGFRTPSKNIACQVFSGSLRCDILSGLRPEPRRSCELDWTGLTLPAKGRGQAACAGDTVFDPRAPILRYRQTWRRGPFVCVSRRAGFRCTNRAGHGFFLARERWRLF